MNNSNNNNNQTTYNEHAALYKAVASPPSPLSLPLPLPPYALHAALAPLKFYTPLHQFGTQPERIDELVALEMQQMRDHYADEEQRYVEQMLIEHPIVVERRAMPTTTTTSAAVTKTATTKDGNDGGIRETLLQRQRAESCRKSRYNNKIKKAKLRYRHKFITNQMSERANVLDYIRGVIAQAETQLLSRGYSNTALEKLRHAYGVDRPLTTNDSNSNTMSD